MENVKRVILRFVPRSVLFRLKSIHYVRALRAFSEVDEPDLKVVRQLVRPGETVWDVGANVGWYTKTLSELVGSQGAVVALEPIHETFSLLSSCVKRLGLNNVRLMNVGASDRDSTGVMWVPEYETGGDNFYRARIVDESQNLGHVVRLPVALRALDSIALEIPGRVEFVKCDVEGHELELVRGADRLIKERQAAWLIEISSDPDEEGSCARKIFEIFLKSQYSVWWLDGRVLRRRQQGQRALNYFFLLPRHVAAMKEGTLDLEDDA